MTTIHPTALVDRLAELSDDVRVGPYSVIRGKVIIGAGTHIKDHSVLEGPTRIGTHCVIGPSAFVGLDPQHLKFQMDPLNPTWLVIGDGVTIRETATVHRAIHPGEEHATRIGNRCYLMGGVHIAHDCVLGEDVIMANASLLGGHCRIGDGAFLGGGSTAHQFVRMGRLAIISGNEPFSQDVPPFAAVRYGKLKGYNAVGCRRAGLEREAISAIRGVYQRLQLHRITSVAVAAIRDEVFPVPEVLEILDFITTSKRGIMPSARGRGRVESEAD